MCGLSRSQLEGLVAGVARELAAREVDYAQCDSPAELVDSDASVVDVRIDSSAILCFAGHEGFPDDERCFRSV